ncbi:uncharacterized protein [Phyllobates terribilis]|uniref:uncharacterized protein n=1 Tax=Phyllobates terribilis TaxID=111132 RepID=UPI003CCAAA0D
MESVAKKFGVPLAVEKTIGPVTSLSFLGILIDTVEMECRLPAEKVVDLLELVSRVKRLHKITLRELQSLLGKLNFALRIMPMGRAFCRRLSLATAGAKSPHHFIRLRKELRDDLGIWAQFLESYNGKSVWIAPVVNASELGLCIDVSKKQGFAILFRGSWFEEKWPASWRDRNLLDNHTLINLFPIVVSLALWVGSVPVAGSSGIVDRFGMPSRIKESSFRAVKKLIGQSLSTRTWSSYEVAWQQWEEWKATMRDPLESDSLLLLLVGHCWEEGWSVPKINNFMAGLAFGFKIRGLPDVTKATLVRQALKGWRKGWKVRDCRRPISYGLLLALGQLLGSVCKSPWEVKLFRLAFSLAFFGALRLVELVNPSRFVSGGLLKDDVDLYSDRVEVFIRFSKTDQFRKGCKVVLFAVAGSDMCPVHCLSEFGLGVGGFKSPLLVHEDGSFLSRFQLIAVLKKCLKAGGISPKDFSGHSFRIGAAPEAARRGLGDELVKKIGRWESIRFRSYICPAWV